MNPTQHIKPPRDGRGHGAAVMAMQATRAPGALLGYSACRLCTHSVEQQLELACAHPSLREPFVGPQPVALLRAPGAACGPHAARMEPRYLQPDARPL